MIIKVHASDRFEIKYVGVDTAFGRDHKFLDSLPLGLIYFADVPEKLLVFPQCPDMGTPVYSGRGRKPDKAPSIPPCSVKDVATDESVPWEEVVLGMGAKGPIISKDKCIKVVEVRDGKPGKDVWLYVRCMEDGSFKYALCNESMEASPEMVRGPALMRWSIEQCFEECKLYLGMAHYEARSWPAWRRHILFTFIAHLLISKLRRKFSVKMDSPCPAPIILVPVTLDEYREATIQAQNNQPIEHPNIRAYPEKPQQILTIGLIKTLIQSFIPKVGHALTIIDYQLNSAAASFKSHTLAKIKTVMGLGLAAESS
jgi:hypothetical protein